jgi:hypothetical protein
MIWHLVVFMIVPLLAAIRNDAYINQLVCRGFCSVHFSSVGQYAIAVQLTITL